jgi:hypothetical protein
LWPKFEFYLLCFCFREMLFLGFGLWNIIVKYFTASTNNIWMCIVRILVSCTVILILIKMNCRTCLDYHSWSNTIFIIK